MTKMLNGGLIKKYNDRLPLDSDGEVVTLHEGATPLLHLKNLEICKSKGVRLFAKFEGLNPTGSFKDRGMTVAITQALREGYKAVICASTGNTSASAAAYAARAGLPCFVIIPSGKIALGKLAQAVAHGAVVVQIEGNFDAGMEIVKEMAQTQGLAVVNSVNPYRLQGQKTAAFEIIDELGEAPDYHCTPVGNAGNISAYWMGFCEYSGYKLPVHDIYHYQRTAITKKRPIMLGYQAAGAAPLVNKEIVNNPETIATAIRIGNPQSLGLAKKASEDSEGWFESLNDEEIIKNQKLLAQHEGIFCEPASAISVGGALKDIERGRIKEGSVVTCTLTGHGLKDPDIVIDKFNMNVVEVPADRKAVAEIIGRYIS